MGRFVPRALEFGAQLYLWIASVTLAEVLAGRLEAGADGPIHLLALIVGIIIPFALWRLQWLHAQA